MDGRVVTFEDDGERGRRLERGGDRGGIAAISGLTGGVQQGHTLTLPNPPMRFAGPSPTSAASSPPRWPARAPTASLPVVLTGNCHSQQAVVAGVGTEGVGLVWLDGHGDFNTPETTETGYFDGYGLAMIVGDCWQTLCASVPGFTPLPEDRIRSRRRSATSRPGEQQAPGRSARSTAWTPRTSAGIPAPGQRLRAKRISLHVDLDVLDPAHGRANEFAVAPGISADELVAATRAIAREHELAAVTLSAYDPSYDLTAAYARPRSAVLEACSGRSPRTQSIV